MPYKHDYDKILTRLTTILSRLNNGEALSIKELSEEFGVSLRTLQRDFNERLVNLYPIYQDGKRWKMQDGFKIEKNTTIENQIVLNIIDKFAQSIGDGFYTKAKIMLDKIKNSNESPIYTKLNIEDISSKLQDIIPLEIAINEKKVINCQYNYEKNSTKLKLKPLKITNYEGFWYLIALDINSGDKLKKYYLKNISKINLSNKTFEQNSKIEKLLEDSISIWFNENKEPYEVKLYIENIISKYLKRKPISKTQKITKEYEDGSCEISLQITSDMEILPIIKYWLPYMKVIEPKRIKETLQDELKEYIQNIL